MSDPPLRIHAALQSVSQERQRRSGDAALHERVLALKAYQQERFRRTYADLQAQPRYAAATHFFLEELYGPGDFTERDEQFARIVGPMVRLFPQSVVSTVAALADLHALSERLDTAMAGALTSTAISAVDYARAWQATGEPEARSRQLTQMMDVGRALERFTHTPLLRQSLRMMRGPARAAGLDKLQSFLERGFDTFKAMKGAQEFLSTIQRREQRLMERLFAADLVALATTEPSPGSAEADLLGQLP